MRPRALSQKPLNPSFVCPPLARGGRGLGISEAGPASALWVWAQLVWPPGADPSETRQPQQSGERASRRLGLGRESTRGSARPPTPLTGSPAVESNEGPSRAPCPVCPALPSPWHLSATPSIPTSTVPVLCPPTPFKSLSLHGSAWGGSHSAGSGRLPRAHPAGRCGSRGPLGGHLATARHSRCSASCVGLDPSLRPPQPRCPGPGRPPCGFAGVLLRPCPPQDRLSGKWVRRWGSRVGGQEVAGAPGQAPSAPAPAGHIWQVLFPLCSQNPSFPGRQTFPALPSVPAPWPTFPTAACAPALGPWLVGHTGSLFGRRGTADRPIDSPDLATCRHGTRPLVASPSSCCGLCKTGM